MSHLKGPAVAVCQAQFFAAHVVFERLIAGEERQRPLVDVDRHVRVGVKVGGNRGEVQLIAELLIDFQRCRVKSAQIRGRGAVRDLQRVIGGRIGPVVETGALSGTIPIVVEVQDGRGRIGLVREREPPASLGSAIDGPIQRGVINIAVGVRVEEARAGIEARKSAARKRNRNRFGCCSCRTRSPRRPRSHRWAIW